MNWSSENVKIKLLKYSPQHPWYFSTFVRLVGGSPHYIAKKTSTSGALAIERRSMLPWYGGNSTFGGPGSTISSELLAKLMEPDRCTEALSSDDSTSLEDLPTYPNGSFWYQVSSTLTGESKWDESGFAVSVSGDGKGVAVGALSDNGNSNGSVHARVYELQTSEWNPMGSNLDSDNSGDLSGIAVSFSKNWKKGRNRRRS